MPGPHTACADYFCSLTPRQAGPNAFGEALRQRRHLGQMAAGQPGQAAHAPRRAEEMDRSRLAHQPLVAGQRAVGHHRHPRRGELPRLPRQQAQQAGDVAAEFHNDKRGGAFDQFISAVGQRAGFPDADAGAGQFPPQPHGPSPGALADDQPAARFGTLQCRRHDVSGVLLNRITFVFALHSPLSTIPAPTAPCVGKAGGG